MALLTLVAAVGMLDTACKRQASTTTTAATKQSAGTTRTASPDTVKMEWHVSPTSPQVGTEMSVQLVLINAAHAPLSGASLQLEGHMAHPGMAPVIAQATDAGRGLYRAKIALPMEGDWLLLATGSLPDGQRLNRRIGAVKVRP
jgi:hypothetical protein